MASILDKEGVALDIGAYRNAPTDLASWASARIRFGLKGSSPGSTAFAAASRSLAQAAIRNKTPSLCSLLPKGRSDLRVSAEHGSGVPSPLGRRNRVRENSVHPVGWDTPYDSPSASLIADKLSPAAQISWIAASDRHQDWPRQGPARRDIGRYSWPRHPFRYEGD